MESKKKRDQGMNWIRKEKRERIYARDGFTCVYCKATRDGGAQLTLDHVTPVSKGGSNEEANLVTCCHTCNATRGNKAMEDFDKTGKSAAYVASITTRHEKFKIEHVNRSELKGAPYNPRRISPEARKRLKAGLADVGLVEPLVWNRTTGNLLSGHQRLGILDELEGTSDYSLDVSVVEIDAQKEKALNVFFNNASSQGDYDMDALESLVKDLDCDLTGTGFEKEDLSFMEEVKADDEGSPEKPEAEKSLARQADKLENQLVVFFEDTVAVQEFMRRINKATGERYVKGEDVARVLGIEL